jgi:membrane protein implicated in regulation of membrane protease activity
MMTMGKRNFMNISQPRALRRTEQAKVTKIARTRSVRKTRDTPEKTEDRRHNEDTIDGRHAMTDATVWWLLAGGLVAVELVVGSFYLLMLALGLAAAALAAHAGVDTAGQYTVAAVVGSAAVVALYVVKRRRPEDPSVRSLRSVNLDVGETIQVDAWQADGTASVQYRGAQWTAVLAEQQSAQAGLHRIAELKGNRLVLEKI